jgi:hypothetical protein
MTAKFKFESSGKLKQPTSEELASADKDTAIVAISTGKQANGEPYYAYIAVKPSKYAEFYRRSKQRESINLDDYGTIIAAGPEIVPPTEVAKRMSDEYGFDPDFEKKIEAELIKEREKFGTKKENERINDIVAMLKQSSPNGRAAAMAPVNGVASKGTTNNNMASNSGVLIKNVMPDKSSAPTKNGVVTKKTVGKHIAPPKKATPKAKSLWKRLLDK